MMKKVVATKPERKEEHRDLLCSIYTKQIYSKARGLTLGYSTIILANSIKLSADYKGMSLVINLTKPVANNLKIQTAKQHTIPFQRDSLQTMRSSPKNLSHSASQ